MNRRSFLRAAVVAAPAVILTPGLLMPVRKLWTPSPDLTEKSLEDAIIELSKQVDLRGIRVRASDSFVRYGYSVTMVDGNMRVIKL